MARLRRTADAEAGAAEDDPTEQPAHRGGRRAKAGREGEAQAEDERAARRVARGASASSERAAAKATGDVGALGVDDGEMMFEYDLLLAAPRGARLRAALSNEHARVPRGSTEADMASIDAVWAARVAKQPSLYDAPKFRLAGCSVARGSSRAAPATVTVHLGLTSYKEYLGTNCAPSDRDADGNGGAGDAGGSSDRHRGADGCAEASGGRRPKSPREHLGGWRGWLAEPHRRWDEPGLPAFAFASAVGGVACFSAGVDEESASYRHMSDSLGNGAIVETIDNVRAHVLSSSIPLHESSTRPTTCTCAHTHSPSAQPPPP